ncbi:MAG: restriction endonuclease [Candidatus Avelusimicrobium sp.]|uniref:restriction endonuclease n=1 Tax=Candidatus Avelusimicrobium sp. TaxID=3048833 RepID=UPI003F011A5D
MGVVILILFLIYAVCSWMSSVADANKRVQQCQKEAAINIEKAIQRTKMEFSNEALKVAWEKQIIESKKKPLIEASEIFAEYYANNATNFFDKFIYYFKNKRNPSYTSAKLVSELKRETKEKLKELKKYQYIISSYEHMFPWLEDFKEVPLEDTFSGQSQKEEEEKIFSRYLSETEKETLSTSEKFQRSLDRYTNSWDKNNWQIGLFYERYQGYLYEKKGFKVIMNGAKERWQDMGIDLIATKNGVTELIQCKYWAKEKTIYEKYIFQLFGTTINYICEHYPTEKNPLEIISKGIIKPVFITSTELSETARKMAKVLNVIIKENIPLDKNYPKIKCNPSSNNGKIYHLPFDQQYDNFQVSQTSGAFYVATIEEAERAGFRRAYRWRPNPQQNIFNS